MVGFKLSIFNNYELEVMNNILKKSIVFLVIAFNTIKIKTQDNALHESEYKVFVDLCLEIWTKIDLLRAIEVDDAQKALFLEEFINDIFNIRGQVQRLTIKNYLNKSSDKLEHAISLTNELKESFEEAFISVAPSFKFSVGITLLNNIFDLLVNNSSQDLNPYILQAY